MTIRRVLGRARIRAASVLVPGLVASLLMPLSSAQADDSDSLSMESYTRPVNAEPLDLTELQAQPNKLRGLSSADSAQAVLPRETLGQAKSFAPLATEASARYRLRVASRSPPERRRQSACPSRRTR